MSERVITDPSQHGWVLENGEWVWDASGGSGGGADYDDSWIQPELDGKANVGDSYTKAESDSAFQVKGDYIGEAPADGELYVRKDGKWELYKPSSGGGGGFMVPVTPPSTAGEFKFGVKGKSGGGVFVPEAGTWYCNKTSTTATLTIPAGYKFVLQNFISNGASDRVDINGIYIDGVQINTSSETSDRYKTTNHSSDIYEEKYFWPRPVSYICESSIRFTLEYSGDNWWHIFGYFVPADSTRDSAELREVYLKEEAERIAAMPVTQEIPEKEQQA